MEKFLIFALVSVLVCGSVGAVGYNRGHRAAAKDCQIERAAAVQRATEQAQEIARQDAEISSGFEVERTRIQTVYRDKAVEVIREIPADCARCSLSPDGLRLLNNALASGHSTPPANPGQPDQPMRNTRPDPLWHFPGGGREIGGNERKTL